MILQCKTGHLASGISVRKMTDPSSLVRKDTANHHRPIRPTTVFRVSVLTRATEHAKTHSFRPYKTQTNCNLYGFFRKSGVVVSKNPPLQHGFVRSSISMKFHGCGMSCPQLAIISTNQKKQVLSELMCCVVLLYSSKKTSMLTRWAPTSFK